MTVSQPLIGNEGVAEPVQESSANDSSTVLESIQLYGLLIVMLGTVVVFQYLTHGIFLSSGNLFDLGKQVAILGVAAAGVTCVLIMGEFDISIGGAVAFIAAILGALLIQRTDITTSVAHPQTSRPGSRFPSDSGWRWAWDFSQASSSPACRVPVSGPRRSS